MSSKNRLLITTEVFGSVIDPWPISRRGREAVTISVISVESLSES